MTFRSLILFSILHLALAAGKKAVVNNYDNTTTTTVIPPSTPKPAPQDNLKWLMDHGITAMLIIVGIAAILTVTVLICCIIAKCCKRNSSNYNLGDPSAVKVQSTGQVATTTSEDKNSKPAVIKTSLRTAEDSGGENNYEDVTVGDK